MATARGILVLALIVACVAAPLAAAAPGGHGRTAVVHQFALAYLRYINGDGSASALPAVTRAVREAAVEGGRIPQVPPWPGGVSVADAGRGDTGRCVD
jgi:hypothetical protein